MDNAEQACWQKIHHHCCFNYCQCCTHLYPGIPGCFWLQLLQGTEERCLLVSKQVLIKNSSNTSSIVQPCSYRVNNSSDSSEEELYSKRPAPPSSAKPKSKSEAIPLLKLNQQIRSPTPNQTLAEWTVDNMCYNPGKCAKLVLAF